MKTINTLIKLAAAATAIAGIAFLVVKYFDAIKAWMAKLCPCCALEEDFVAEDEVAVEETAEEAVEEPAEEVAAEEVVEDDAPVAEDSDFEA